MKEAKSVPDLQNIPIFSALPTKKRHLLEAKLRRFEFAPGKCLILQGCSGQFLGILESGQLVLESAHSQTQTLTSGQYFGSEMLQDGKPSAFTITTQRETKLWVLNRADWLDVSASLHTRRSSAKSTRWRKVGFLLLVMIISLAMLVLILGPPLLEDANHKLPHLVADAGRPHLAEEYLRFVIRWQPESARVYADLGEILFLQDKEDEAIKAYQQAISLDEYLPWIHNNLGVLLLAQGAANQAVNHFQVAVNLNPGNADAHYNLGNAYYSLGQREAAAKAYQRALDLDPNQLDVRAAEAGILLNEGRLEEAREAWEEVLVEEPGHLLAQKGLGVIAVMEEDPSLALPYLEAVRTADPEDVTTRLYLGLALVALDRPAEAAGELKYVVEMGADPELLELAETHLQMIQE
jgi:tetratricopeptide (TPR) repeat protein